MAEEEEAVTIAQEYLSAFQLSSQYLRNQGVAERICEFLGVNVADRRWVEPFFWEDVTDLVELSVIGGDLLS